MLLWPFRIGWKQILLFHILYRVLILWFSLLHGLAFTSEVAWIAWLTQLLNQYPVMVCWETINSTLLKNCMLIAFSRCLQGTTLNSFFLCLVLQEYSPKMILFFGIYQERTRGTFQYYFPVLNLVADNKLPMMVLNILRGIL